jgi:hypothetical protein
MFGNGKTAKKDSKQISLEISKFIARDYRPFKLAQGLGFKGLFKYLIPDYNIPHPTTISRTYIP